MKKTHNSRTRFLLTVVFLASVLINLRGQTSMPDVLISNKLTDQLNYVEEHTRIYENYRAIREDIFQKVKQNISDTLKTEYQRVNQLTGRVGLLNHRIDSLVKDLTNIKGKLEEVTSTKNSIKLLGMEVNKLAYNSIMWLIVLGLTMLLVIGFLAFRRNLTIVQNYKNELNDLKEEFQSYRTSTREAREKMSMDHFNEIKKLRGG